MNKNSYFASMNTSDGFKCYFDRIFDPSVLDSLYIIKGGSGTGKSTMMKKIGEEYENNHAVEYFRCSSAPDSLDGVMIDRRVAVIDGTAPHITDPKYPGASDKIINLGECLDSVVLEKFKRDIVELTLDKQNSYRKGYSFLSAAGIIKKEITDICKTDFFYEKMSGAVKRFFSQQNYSGEKIGIQTRLIETVSAGGKVKLTAFESNSEKICCIINGHGLEHILLEEFMKISQGRKLLCYQSFDVLDPSKYNALYFPEIKLSVLPSGGNENLYDEKYKAFNMERFVSKDILNVNRSKLRFANKCVNALIQEASECFLDAKNIHEKIESIYGGAVDFEKVNEIGEGVIREISKILYK